MKNRNVVYIRVLLVVLSIVVLLAFINRSPRRAQHDTWLPSSFNPVGAGNMALFQTLQELKWPVERWREPLGRLSNYGTGNVLIITRSRLGSSVNFTVQEEDLLDDWVKKGNTLLLLGALEEWDDTRTFLRQIGFTLPERRVSVSNFLQPFERETEQAMEIQPAIGANQAGRMVLPRSAPLPITFPANAKILWQDHGDPYLIDVPRGAGHVICGASDRLLGNSFLVRGDNLAIVLQLLAPGGRGRAIFSSRKAITDFPPSTPWSGSSAIRESALPECWRSSARSPSLEVPSSGSAPWFRSSPKRDARRSNLSTPSPIFTCGPTCATTRSDISLSKRTSACCTGSISPRRPRMS